MTAPAPAPAPAVYSIAIFVNDIGRAIEFYRDKLALPLVKRGSFGAEFFGEGTRIGVPCRGSWRCRFDGKAGAACARGSLVIRDG